MQLAPALTDRQISKPLFDHIVQWATVLCRRTHEPQDKLVYAQGDDG